MALFSNLHKGLSRTRRGLASLFGASALDEDFYEELEDQLVLADVGGMTASRLVDDLRNAVRARGITEPEDAREVLAGLIAETLEQGDPTLLREGKINVVMVIGVNGAGKTTTVGKLAARAKADGHRVLIAAADTFRAAAADQLETWAARAGVDFVRREEGSDPGAVLYDAFKAARSKGSDVIFVDTAGRLHNKKNLMDELAKLGRIMDREMPDAHREVLLVLDGATGGNAKTQAELFSAATPVTGLVLTKLDGTAKGGVVISIMDSLPVPVKFIGVGEGIEDLLPFDAQDFAEALLTPIGEAGGKEVEC